MTIKLPQPAGVITSKLGDHVGFKSAEVKKGDVIYTHTQLVQAVKDALEEAISFLHGIDMQEQEHPDGWWETSTGAEFGAAKIDAIRAMKGDIQ